MAVTSNLAGLARVAYETVGLSEFRSDNDAAERAYKSATEGMSDGAIKLELANERLRRSLAKGPSAGSTYPCPGASRHSDSHARDLGSGRVSFISPDSPIAQAIHREYPEYLEPASQR